MPGVHVKENETLDSALRRFKKSCAKSGIISEIKKREHYEKPSVKRKKKAEVARKRGNKWEKIDFYRSFFVNWVVFIKIEIV